MLVFWMGGVPEQETVVAKKTPRDRAPPRDDATLRDRTPPRDNAPTRVDAVVGTTNVGTPIEALERDEILRTRKFGLMVFALAIVGTIAATFVPGGDPLGKGVMYGACALAIASMSFLVYQTLDPARFRQRRTAFAWFFPAICVNAAVFFFGVFSPAPMLVVVGLYFIGLGRSRGMALFAYAICVVLHAGMAAIPILGYPDRGVVHPDLTTTQAIIVHLCVQTVLLVTMIVARMSRQTALLAVSELEQAVRLAAHRQALLLEARDELERALRTKRGRFSEQTIGRYKLGDVLGRGAMGEVYAAVDQRTGDEVAIKLLSSPSLGNPDHVRRFFRELRTAASVESPHVVRVIEVGEQPLPHLVMERLDGHTLAEMLRERRTLSPDEVIELVTQVGIGITAANEAGIVHRDLKPQNVFRHRDTWKILDFGVARAVAHGDTLTAGQLVGTPSYMSPEQASGGTVDHRSDLYALAAVAYRALTGHPPFAAKEVAETLYLVVHTRPMRPTLLAPELSPDVDLVLAIGMARRASDRFANAGELAAALRDAVRANLGPAWRARGLALVEEDAWSSGRKRLIRPRAAP